jgi:glutathione S-transferase
MKLYIAPGACSLASHILLREAGIPFELERVDLRAKKTASGADFTAINPKGYVPALQLDNGELLTENVAVLTYIADQKPEKNLAPPAGTLERYRLLEWLGFVSSEVHKSHSIFFNPAAGDDIKQIYRGTIARRYGWLQEVLSAREFLMGSQFTAADAYLFTVSRWASVAGVDLAQWPALKGYADRIRNRAQVQEALRAEGLDQPKG